MNSRQRINNIFNGNPVDRNGFWIGDIHKDIQGAYFEHFHVNNEIELAAKLGSDFIWKHADRGAWSPPDGKMLFANIVGGDREGDYAILADCDSVKDIDAFELPDLNHFDFNKLAAVADQTHEAGLAFFSGMWAPFFHIVSDSFGMENYFMKMYDSPAVVEALTEKVTNFYLEANARCLDAMADKIDAYFFGNDLGSQLDLLISPECFDKFVLPSMKKLVNQAKSYGLKVVMHSCGSISRIIPTLIDIGIDAIHPIQAKAAGMDAESLAKQYLNDLVFIGGVDAQGLLPFGSPAEINQEVKRLKKIFGEKLIVSSSHEKILPNVKPENIEAIALAVQQ